MQRLTLHEYAASGNCYKIRLTAAHLGLSLERVTYDIMRGETRTSDYLERINANGRIPVLQIDQRFLPESNAACVWLAYGSDLIPADRFDHADMLRWMFWEQYSHEPNVATLRFWRAFVGEVALTEAQHAQIPGKEAAGHAALALMDEHLSDRDWFAGGAFSLADVVLYPYTHAAPSGGFDLSRYPAVTRWLKRVASRPGHMGMDE